MFLLLLHLLPESGAYLFLPFDFLLQILQFVLHADYFNVQIFSALRIVIGRILDLQPYLLELLLLFLQFCVFLLDILNLMHVLLEYLLQIFNRILGLLVHGSILLDIQVVFLEFGLDFLLGCPEIILHLLVHIGNFLLQLLGLEQLVLIGSLLRFVGDFGGLEGSGKFLSFFGDFGLAIVGSFVLMLDGSEILFENAHGFIERIVVFLGIIDDFEEGFDDARHLIELLLRQLPLLVEVLDRFRPVLHVHGNQILLVAH